MRTSYLVGIIPRGTSNNYTLREEYPLVQSRCSYTILDVYSLAHLIQDYYSAATLNRDVEYVFPLPPSAAVCSFKAVINDKRVIKGVVKEKKEAKRAFDQAVAQGKTAGLLQQEHANVFRVSLGNIKPKTKISVHISFVSIIPHDGSSPQTLRLTMPTAIAPRYGTPPPTIPWAHHTNPQNRFELSVSVQMNGKKAITSISSPSHPIGLTLGCHQQDLTGDYDPSKAFVYLGTSTMLDKDIVVVISAQGLDTPRCSVERWLKSEGGEETTDAYALTLVPKFELPALPRQEYIFLVDRSASMEGGRMTAVKAALQILLRSLPSHSTRFNIVSFGSNHSSLWPTSQPYTANTMEHASHHVDSMEANYGGTELWSALHSAIQSRHDVKQKQKLAVTSGNNNNNNETAANSEKMPTSVFVLTDGEAWDVERIVQGVSRLCESAKLENGLLRTFVLGVGHQVSTAMCEGIARAGKGLAVFVAEDEKPDAKLMGLLKAARGGVIDDLAVDWGVDEEGEDNDEDEFEVVRSAVQSQSQPLPPPAPLNLFDESHVEVPVQLGAKESIVLLDPPPRVQQAPKSEKLPIPLYPGFRCSIFAIVRRRSTAHPGSYRSHVNITGKVMGREVVLQIPVTPVSASGIDNNNNENPGGVEEASKQMVGSGDGGKLLHTLAAKALIQVFEDLPKTEENKAEIERLGKRYSLASSVTSFVAIDDNNDSNNNNDSRDHESELVRPPSRSEMVGQQGQGDLALALQAALTQQKQQLGVDSNDDDEDWAELREEESSGDESEEEYARSGGSGVKFDKGELPDDNAITWYSRRSAPAAPAAPAPIFHGPVSFDMLMDLTGLNIPSPPPPPPPPRPSQAPALPLLQPQPTGMLLGTIHMDADKARRGRPMPARNTVAEHMVAREAAENQAEAAVAAAMAAEQTILKSSAPGATTTSTTMMQSSSNVISPPKPVNRLSRVQMGWNADVDVEKGKGKDAWKVLTVEWIARTQRFDGSFPSDRDHFVFLFKGDEALANSAIQSLPQSLLLLSNDETKRATIWATIVTLTCLEKKFAGERAGWELLADKAREFVRGALRSLGLTEIKVGEALKQLEGDAGPLFELGTAQAGAQTQEKDFLSFWLD